MTAGTWATYIRFDFWSASVLVWLVSSAGVFYFTSTAVYLWWKHRRRDAARILPGYSSARAVGDGEYEGPNVAARWVRINGRQRKHTVA